MIISSLKVIFKKILHLTLKGVGKKYIIVLSHTRSGSTLLTQILCSNSEIKGHGELFIPYHEQGEWALANIPITLYKRKLKGLIKSNYYLDKVLFNQLITNYKLFNTSNAKFIFLFRSPYDSLPSIFKKENDMNNLFTQKNAFDYYKNRLDELVYCYQLIAPENRITIHYEDLINNTQHVLSNISIYLDLNNELSSYYKPYNKKSGYIGDYSSNIFEGKVLKSIVSTANNITFDVELLNLAYEHYYKCLSTIGVAPIKMEYYSKS